MLGNSQKFKHHDGCLFCRGERVLEFIDNPGGEDDGREEPYGDYSQQKGQKFFEALREGAYPLIEKGQWDDYWCYRANVMWFFDFSMDAKLLKNQGLYDNDKDPNSNLNYRHMMKNETLRNQFNDHCPAERKYLGVPPHASDQTEETKAIGFTTPWDQLSRPRAA